MIRFLWEHGVDIEVAPEFEGTLKVNEIECELNKNFAKNVKKELADCNIYDLQYCLSDDFIAINEDNEEVQEFIQEDPVVTIHFPFEVYVKNQKIKSLDDITEDYMLPIVNGIEKALKDATQTTFGDIEYELNYVFNKAYLED